MICKLSQYFLPSFEIIGLSVLEKKCKMDFQDSCHGSHLRFLAKTILAIFDLQGPPILPTKFWVGFLVQEKKCKIEFQDGHYGHLGFPIRSILAIFDLQVAPINLTKFWFNWPFGSGEEAQNRFYRWQPRQPSWISDQKNWATFDLQVTQMLPTKFWVNWPRDVGGVSF